MIINFPVFRIGLYLSVFMLVGCASMATARLATTVSNAMLNQDDLETVRTGAPAYLLMLDGLISDDPENTSLLMAGAKLYGAYSSVFVDNRERSLLMANKAYRYAQRAICLREVRICLDQWQSFDNFSLLVSETGRSDVPFLYTYAVAWAGLIAVRSDEWGVLADLPKVEVLLDRVVELDETYEGGQAHLYLGVIRSQLPSALGGRPELGRAHFERAIELSDGKNLLAKAEYARNYARLLFDKKLHDRLLNEVIDADANVYGLVLVNTLAKKQARELLATSAEYFGE